MNINFLGPVFPTDPYAQMAFVEILNTLLVVSEILPFIILTNRFKSATCKILHHETKF